MENDRYEAISLIVKQREDGQSWFDCLYDLVTKDCKSDPELDENTCTCGMETMGGMSGTLEQCYDHQLNITRDISPIMVARAVCFLVDGTLVEGDNELTDKVIKWARKEIEWEDNWET